MGAAGLSAGLLRGKPPHPEKPLNGHSSTETPTNTIIQALHEESQALPRTAHEPQALNLNWSFSALVFPPGYLSSLCGTAVPRSLQNRVDDY